MGPVAQEDTIGVGADRDYLMYDENAVTDRAAARWIAFLQNEIDVLPQHHPMVPRYRAQLSRLRRGFPGGPVALR
jgi:hypothetical protein